NGSLTFSIFSRGFFDRRISNEIFRDPAALGGYVVTDFARSALARMQEGLRPNSGKRAWRITGHYGAGKSSFALLLAHLLSGKEANLPPQIRRVVDVGRNEPPFVSVL